MLFFKDNLTETDNQELLAIELASPLTAKVFGITKENGLAYIETKKQLFSSVYAEVIPLGDSIQLSSTLWNLWLPLAIHLSNSQEMLARPLIQGILGVQGSGKTTLTKVISLILSKLGKTSIFISLDDIYKTYTERLELMKLDPRLIWRGPPGTHDVKLGIEILDRLREKNSTEVVEIPRFDKSAYQGSGDRTTPKTVEQADIILFEGWFVGVRPIAETAFENPPEPINTPEDRSLAKDMNEGLKEYLPLWERLDSLMVLYPRDYRFSKQWRQEAEQQAIAQGKAGMSNTEIENFVDYFWKSLHPELFIKPLISNTALVDIVVEIEGDRTIKSIYPP